MHKGGDQLVVPPIPVIDGEPVMHFTTAQVCSALNCSPASLRELLTRAPLHPVSRVLLAAASGRGRSKRTYFYTAVYRAADLLGNGEEWPVPRSSSRASPSATTTPQVVDPAGNL